MNRWTLIAIAAMLVFGMTVALAQQTGGCVPVDTSQMTDEQRAAQGYHYDPATGDWYAPDDGASRMDPETGRYVDTSFPNWSYDREAGRWYDEARPGWSYDPMMDRWYSEDRPGEAYDLRTGRWYDEEMDRQRVQQDYEYDRTRNRWYDYGNRQQRMNRMGASSYYDPDMGRWRNEPMDFRDRDQHGQLREGYRPRHRGYTDTGPRGMYDGGMYDGGMRDDHMGMMQSAGNVRARTWPSSFRPGGDVVFDIRTDPNVQIGDNDTVTAYLTPDDPSSNARYPVMLGHKGGNEFIGRADITRMGKYKMIIRVSPQSGPDRVLHYPVEID